MSGETREREIAARYDYERNEWAPHCPYGTECPACDLNGKCAAAYRPDALLAELAAARQETKRANGRLALLGAHDFVGRHDRDCERCGKPDRHPLHSAAMVPAALAAADTDTPTRPLSAVQAAVVRCTCGWPNADCREGHENVRDCEEFRAAVSDTTPEEER